MIFIFKTIFVSIWFRIKTYSILKKIAQSFSINYIKQIPINLVFKKL